MADSDMLLEDDRSVELSSISAIYPEIIIDPASPFRVVLDLPVKPSTPLRVCFHQNTDVELPTILTPPTSFDELVPVDFNKDVHVISYLPPLRLEIDLPESYPSDSPPRVQLCTDPSWLPSDIVQRLIDDCERLWEECGRDLVVYTYIDHLQQLAETAFGIDDIPDGEVRLPRELRVALLDFKSRT